MRKLLTASLVIFMAGAGICSCGPPDNVAACDKFMAASKCGTIDMSAEYTCSAFADTSCDMSSYFDCLTQHYVCNNGMFDPGRVATVSECSQRLICK